MRTSPPVGVSGDFYLSRSAQQFATLGIFTFALFLSALLLFVVQPMFAKIILPILGGAPAVWAVAMVFFQSALLLGYAYAHGLTRWCPHKYAPLVHMGFMIVGGLLLPLSIASGWTEPPAKGVHLWVFGLFAISIGLPFVALSANGPLLQAWFSRTGHPHSSDPYFLYGSSNTGSLLALLAYPVAFEPLMTLNQQTSTWSLGYSILILVIGACGFLMVLRAGTDGAASAGILRDGNEAAPVSMKDRAFWVALSAIPSALLIGVTNHMTTDVAAVPFLWVLPLALFLMTFIIVFQRKPIIPHRWMRRSQPFAALALLIFFAFPSNNYWVVQIGVHLGAFFIFSMVCHGELVKRRPDAANLTQFYLFMSLGGMIGGVLAGLVAPNVFSSALEYPIAIVLSMFAARSIWLKPQMIYQKELILFCLGIVLCVLFPKMANLSYSGTVGFTTIAVISLIVPVIIWRARSLRVGGLIALGIFASLAAANSKPGHTKFRGFYGIHSVRPYPTADFRALAHGTTIHGMQRLNDPARQKTGRPTPLMYYHAKSGFADAIHAMRDVAGVPSVGVVGLGTGALACYKKPNENWTFFEIDPLIVRIAKDKSLFTFVGDCAPNAPIVMGDARIKLAKQPRAKFDLLIVDAFSSDVVPAHLLTIEAMKEYLRTLSQNGMLVMHISNRYAELRPVLGAAARELGLRAIWTIGIGEKGMSKRGLSLGLVVALSRTDVPLADLKQKLHWKPLTAANDVPWTDDYSNMLGAIWAKQSK